MRYPFPMRCYLDLLQHVLDVGEDRMDRTGMGTKSTFGTSIRINLQKGFPLLTTKKLNTKAIVIELLWFLQGGTNTDFLNKHNVHIWDEWADKDGNLGPIYGKQWRSWTGSHQKSYDQIQTLIENLQSQPTSRRHLVSAWNVGEIQNMALPPCHAFFQFYVSQGRFLSCQMYQRSADLFLGVPFNIASYALLTHMIAMQTNLDVGELVMVFGDTHIYQNHLSQVKEQLTRTPFPLPTLILNKRESIDDYVLEDVTFQNYQAHPHIKGKIAV